MRSSTSASTEIEIDTEQPDPGYYTPEAIAAILEHRRAADAAQETRHG